MAVSYLWSPFSDHNATMQIHSTWFNTNTTPFSSRVLLDTGAWAAKPFVDCFQCLVLFLSSQCLPISLFHTEHRYHQYMHCLTHSYQHQYLGAAFLRVILKRNNINNSQMSISRNTVHRCYPLQLPFYDLLLAKVLSSGPINCNRRSLHWSKAISVQYPQNLTQSTCSINSSSVISHLQVWIGRLIVSTI